MSGRGSAGAASAAAGAAAAGAPQQYVGLVRGINVGGNNRITMADFRAIFEGLGFSDVKTLLQSGNVVFASDRPLALADVRAIEHAFETAAGFRAGFVVLSAAQFLSILDANPLLAIGTDLSRLVVTFLPQPPAAAPAPDAAPPPDAAPAPDAGPAAAAAFDATSVELPDAASTLPEVFAAGPHAVYSWHPDGISNSRVPVSFWKQFGPVYTARNVNTANKLAALLRARTP
ncbi:DUF1697 domain-containing protein [Subtercola boreus]|uniref:DUF1697 domain-containing protein n=1 Tax=Subtercola boreus TaxID=120213 RepID=UPI00116EA769|nr:DUF1697 domain-containing protein [Subtercola boreus]TQL54278.1 uncharacterized protein (DUF1697 family) [Subtercola boreus]